MPASSHSERRSSSPLAPPPAKQVPGGFSLLTATCMQRGESRSAVMVVEVAAVGPVFTRRRCRTERPLHFCNLIGNRLKWALRGAFGSRGISKIPTLKLKLKVKIVADGTKNDLLPD